MRSRYKVTVGWAGEQARHSHSYPLEAHCNHWWLEWLSLSLPLHLSDSLSAGKTIYPFRDSPQEAKYFFFLLISRVLHFSLLQIDFTGQKKTCLDTCMRKWNVHLKMLFPWSELSEKPVTSIICSMTDLQDQNLWSTAITWVIFHSTQYTWSFSVLSSLLREKPTLETCWCCGPFHGKHQHSHKLLWVTSRSWKKLILSPLYPLSRLTGGHEFHLTQEIRGPCFSIPCNL